MINALKAEVLKLRTTRTFIALVAVAVGLTILIVALGTIFGGDFDQDQAGELLGFDAIWLFMFLLGAIGITGEWRHRTITSSLLAAPSRVNLIVAKTVAYAVAGALLSVCVTLAVAGVAALVLSIRDQELFEAAALFEHLARNAAVSALLAAFGVAVGSVVRNQVLTVVGVVILTFVVEPLLFALWPEGIRFAPFRIAPSGIATEEAESAIEAGGELLSPGIAALVELGWIAGFCALGAFLLQRRDVG